MAVLQGIEVKVYIKTGSGDSERWNYVDSTTTAVDGSYSINGLDDGIYRMKFTDPNGNYKTQYWFTATTGASSLETASDISVTSPAITYKDFQMDAAGSIEGNVTSP